MAASTRRYVRFDAPRSVSVVEASVPQPAPDEVLVHTTQSGISPGTERLIYRGNAPEHLQADSALPALEDGSLSFPLTYGYACVGTVERVGENVEDEWRGRRVFCFHPHASHFTCAPDELVPLPPDISDDQAVLLPSVETAVTLLMDGRPMIGERVVVFGAGVVGLLSITLLADHPIDALICVEPRPARRDRARAAGATTVLPPSDEEALRHELGITAEDPREAGPNGYEGADLIYEISGASPALDTALSCVGYGGRVVVGSWYGTDPASLHLGGRFHRSRVRLIASQVSTIDPEYRGRWSKARRMDTALSVLSTVAPESLITHRFPVSDAADAYRALDQEDVLQPVFEY